MSVAHHVITVDDQVVGHALSLDARYVFYAALAGLKHLDGQRFASVAAVRAAAEAALAAAPAHRPTGRAPAA